jgi:3-oxoacyl-[acyl-carrier-protein] synthase-3
MDNLKNNIGITAIGTYIPHKRVSNFEKMIKFGVDESFIENKIGIDYTSQKDTSELTSDLCVKAINELIRNSNVSLDELQCLIIVTQNPDNDGLPHTSAIVHKKLGINSKCSTFDISLGCSGFVYGIAVIQSFMCLNNFTKGILVTCDPYSEIVNEDDKNTSLLFGDAATATLFTDNPIFKSENFIFGTHSEDLNALESNNRQLFMDGRAVFNFAATQIPKQVRQLVIDSNYEIEQIDLFLFHQGSKYIIDTLVKKIGINPEKAPSNLKNIGNTVSSSIPLLLYEYINNSNIKIVFLSGFGVGLSTASCILRRVA